jgi:hypothetical protein
MEFRDRIKMQIYKVSVRTFYFSGVKVQPGIAKELVLKENERWAAEFRYVRKVIGFGR